MYRASKDGSFQPINYNDSIISSRQKNALQVRQHTIIIRSAPGGAPQGTRSGNFLFCVTVDGLGDENYLHGLNVDHVLEHQIDTVRDRLPEEGDRSPDLEEVYMPRQGEQSNATSSPPRSAWLSLSGSDEEEEDNQTDLGLSDLYQRISVDRESMGTSTIRGHYNERWQRGTRRIADSSKKQMSISRDWVNANKECELHKKMFMDNLSGMEWVPLANCYSKITTKKESRFVHRIKSEVFLEENTTAIFILIQIRKNRGHFFQKCPLHSGL